MIKLHREQSQTHRHHNFNPIKVYIDIRTNARSVVKQHRSDWKHDRQALRNAKQELTDGNISTIAFVHVSTESGTHLWFEEFHNLDQKRKILFGTATPRETMLDIASIFAPDSSSISDHALIQYFDGTTVTLIDKDQAHKRFKTAAARPDTLPPLAKINYIQEII